MCQGKKNLKQIFDIILPYPKHAPCTNMVYQPTLSLDSRPRGSCRPWRSSLQQWRHRISVVFSMAKVMGTIWRYIYICMYDGYMYMMEIWWMWWIEHFSWVDQRTKWAILSILNSYVTLPEALWWLMILIDYSAGQYCTRNVHQAYCT